MLIAVLRWIGRNLSTLLLSFVLAVVVWVSAVSAADPLEERAYPRLINLDIEGQAAGMTVMGEVPKQVRVTINAPRSIWNRLNTNPDLISAWIDISGLGAGTHTVDVNTRVDIKPARVISVEPSEVHFSLEPTITRMAPVQLSVDGDPPAGYRKDNPQMTPAEVTISGPESAIQQVAQVRAQLNISGASETVNSSLPVEAVDENGNPVNGITITPKTVTVTQPVSLLGGFKNVVVKVVTEGKIANGYRLTNISVSPLTVTVFSSNPQLVNALPGFVETEPVNLDGLNEDIEIRAALNLPPEVSLVGGNTVLVQVSVAAIEGSITVSLPVESLGLPPDLTALISPPLVDVIVSGPLPVLETLTSASFRVVVDLTGLEPGIYQLKPVVDLAPDQVTVQSVLPETLEVTVTTALTPTPGSGLNLGVRTPTPTAATPTVTPTP